MSHDRTRKESFFLGHLFISYMLVVPQATVNRAMETLANAKLITYTYDRIDILNRQQLEKASCECYGDIKRGYDRILDAAVSVKRVFRLSTPDDNSGLATGSHHSRFVMVGARVSRHLE